MYTPGWDFFTPDLGTVESMKCKVCKTKMDVKKNVDTATSYVERLSGISREVDIFTCPHSEENWHQQAMALRKFVSDTPSATLAMLVQRELDNVLKNKKSTKEIFNKLL